MEIMEFKVAIVMATYNGEKYLGEQIESIINQSYNKWNLFIRDDNSFDNTLGIIKEYAAQDSRIIIIEDNMGNKGNCQNFSELLNYVNDYQYILFSDQDDYWYKNKVKMLVDEIGKNENDKKPIAVYSNYYVSDSNLNNKEIVYRKEPESGMSLISIDNCVMGCTLIINNTLLNKIKNIPQNIMEHDRWIASIAKAYDGLIYYKYPLIIHRIHDENVTTSQKNFSVSYKVKNYIYRITNSEYWIRKQNVFNKELIQRLKENNITNKDLLNCKMVFSKDLKYSIMFCKKNKIKKRTFFGTIFFYIAIIKHKNIALSKEDKSEG